MPQQGLCPLLEEPTEQALDRFFEGVDRQYPPRNLYDLVLDAAVPAMLKATLRFTGGNQLAAADILGITRTTLRTKLEHYRIKPEDYRDGP